MRSPIGVDNFGKLIKDITSQGEHYLYIDKTPMIGDILDEAAQIVLLTRPRRFGKTMALSMLEHFLAEEVNGLKTKGLFDGLKISQNEVYMKYQGQYPVIFITFKNLKHANWNDMFEGIQKSIRTLYKEHEYLLDSPKISQSDKDEFRIYFGNLSNVAIQNSIQILCELLKKHHGKSVYVLLDEYDTPIHEAYLNGFYKQTIDLMRGLFDKTFKGNDALEKGILTGITRVSKESLFSGFNNPAVYTILEPKYSQYFGFTPEEVKALCPQHFGVLSQWYNGYEFGVGSMNSLEERFRNQIQTILNPWSVLHFFFNNYTPGHYWINSSNNALVGHLLKTEHLKLVEVLLKHEKIEAIIDTNLSFEDLDTDEDAFFSILLMAGYLTMDKEFGLRIPNKEVEDFFVKMLKKWFTGRGDRFFDDFIKAFLLGNVMDFKERFQIIVQQSLSAHDVAYGKQESFYHGLMLGFLIGLRDCYIIKSNAESGFGRYDIGLIPKDPSKYPGIIIECKYEAYLNSQDTSKPKAPSKAKAKAKLALKQISDKAYAAELRQHGCTKILLYGLAFDGKEIDIMLATEEA